MKIIVNSDEFDLEESSNLLDVFSLMNLVSDKGMAIAVNDMVVPRLNWDSTYLKEGDHILIIKAASGG